VQADTRLVELWRKESELIALLTDTKADCLTSVEWEAKTQQLDALELELEACEVHLFRFFSLPPSFTLFCAGRLCGRACTQDLGRIGIFARNARPADHYSLGRVAHASGSRLCIVCES